ncbi:MAG: ankyrin repeat domain-containing protein [Thermoguttaceae bacterium]|nr:ankyrin repeat domain-containing protein [Thermoguttaceae bacterium]MDW8036481.1 ankyrin repeat domain-containing protein [Thermoguttaceae bacterium]
MQEAFLPSFDSPPKGPIPPLQPGQCWQISVAVAPFAGLVVLLGQVRQSDGVQCWEVAIPRADLADWLLNQTQSSVLQRRLLGGDSHESSLAATRLVSWIGEPSQETSASLGKEPAACKLPGGLLVAVPEENLKPSLQQLLAEGLQPAEVRRLLRLPDRVHFIEGLLEQGLSEAVAAWQWEADQLQAASAENFLWAIRQGHSEAVCQMLSKEPSLLEQLLAEEPPAISPSAGRPLGSSGGAVEPSQAPAPALCWAVRFGQPEMVRLLLEKGADPNRADANGDRPLHWAARLGHLEIAQILLAHGAAVDLPNQAGERPLLLAARCSAWDGPRLAQLLLDAGAQADLNSLVALGRVEQVRELLQQSEALSNAPQPKQLLQDALWAIQRAISRRIAPAVTDPQTMDALMEEYLPMLQGLLEAGLDPNEGFPLWTAVQLPDPRPAAMLLRWGADPNQKIYENMFPLEVARTEGIRSLLCQYGAKHPDDPALVVQRQTQRLAQCPEDTEAIQQRAEAWAKLGEFQKALADWASLIQLAPEQPEGYLGQAWIWASCPQEQFRDGQAALHSAQRAVELAGGWQTLADQRIWNPQTGQVSVRTEYWITYAAALAELGQFPQAVQILEQVLPLCSAAERPRIRYLRALFAAGQAYRIRPLEEEQLLYQQFADQPPPPGLWNRVKNWFARWVRCLRGRRKQ